MKWRGRRGSSNVEDRRGTRGKGMAVGGLGGIGAIVAVILLLLQGGDPTQVLNQVGGTGANPTQSPNDAASRFASVVLADTEQVWHQLFTEMDRTYAEPTLVIFEGAVQSACGTASSGVGPFYCPADASVYVDLSFFTQLEERFGAPGDFAQAYVIAHEVGHHVQKLLGISDAVRREQQRVSAAEANDLSVRMELQADFFAGVWAHYADEVLGVVEEGDVEEALTAAAAIGDDRIQMETQGYAVPDTFTHGTSEQRVRWFRLGYRTGDVEQGDTFSARRL